MTKRNGRKPTDEEIGLPALNLHIQDQAARERWPHILNLCDPRWDGSKLKSEGGSMSITPMGSFWKVVLRCPSYKREFACLVISLVDAFDKLNEELGAGRLTPMPTYSERKKLLTSKKEAVE